MTIFKPDSAAESGVIVNLGPAGNGALVRGNVILISVEDAVIAGANNRHVVTVSGFVQSQGATAVVLGEDEVGTFGNRLVVTKTGNVSAGFDGLFGGAYVLGRGTVLENAGKIAGLIGSGFGVEAGQTAVMENDGIIFGQVGVIRLAGLGAARLINTGVIEGATSYSGQFLGGPIEARDVIINSGVMRGSIDLSAGDDLYDGTRGGRVDGTIFGSDGDDVFLLGAKAENILGGDDFDKVDYSRATGAIKVALDGTFANTGSAKGDTLAEIEQVRGTRFGDTIRGTAGPETLLGADGRDRLIGSDGFNFLVGGKGQDTLSGGADTDIFQMNAPADFGDRITNFNALVDTILFDIAFAGRTGGSPTAAHFRTRADNQAQDANDRFIFRTTDKTLWFDRDGAGGQGPMMVVDLQQGATLTASDIFYFLL